MGIEQRRNSFYYYRKRRIGGRVVSEYMGGGDLAHLVAHWDSIKREGRDEERHNLTAKRAELMAEDKALADLEQTIGTLVQGILLVEGYHTHKGQWRRTRGNKES